MLDMFDKGYSHLYLVQFLSENNIHGKNTIIIIYIKTEGMLVDLWDVIFNRQVCDEYHNTHTHTHFYATELCLMQAHARKRTRTLANRLDRSANVAKKCIHIFFQCYYKRVQLIV